MQTLKTNADFCGSLPLQFINQIQEYGVLLVVDTDGRIIQVSQNIDQLLGKEPSKVQDTMLSDHLSIDSVRRLRQVSEHRKENRLMATLSFGKDGVLRPVIIHYSEMYMMLEIELVSTSQRSFLSMYEEIKLAMAAINAADTIDGVCNTAIGVLKQLSDFDRIMIYRFDEAWNGVVIAEVAEQEMDPYIGLRFPASDIPRQARALYHSNPYRFIPDRSYTPVKLYPVVNPKTNTFTDLSPCNLRSVAGVHLEYLSNMGVEASMSTRILKDGELWGLISCHHRTKKVLNYEQCSIFELLSDVISSRLLAIEARERTNSDVKLQQELSQFVANLYQNGNLERTIMNSNLLQVFRADGIAYTRQNTVSAIGRVPDEKALRQLIYWLRARQDGSIYQTRNLSAGYDEAKDVQAIASGLLAIPLRPDKEEYVLVFRPEEPEEVSWGGNPNEALIMEADGKNYHPRNSFKTWQESVRGFSMPWEKAELDIASRLKQSLTDFLLHKMQ